MEMWIAHQLPACVTRLVDGLTKANPNGVLMLAPPRSASKFAKNISNLDKIVARGVFLPKRVTDIKKEEGIIVVEVDQAKGSERNPFEHPVFVPTQSPLRRAFTVDGEDNRSSPSPFRLDLKGLESIELSFGDSFMKDVFNPDSEVTLHSIMSMDQSAVFSSTEHPVGQAPQPLPVFSAQPTIPHDTEHSAAPLPTPLSAMSAGGDAVVHCTEQISVQLPVYSADPKAALHITDQAAVVCMPEPSSEQATVLNLRTPSMVTLEQLSVLSGVALHRPGPLEPIPARSTSFPVPQLSASPIKPLLAASGGMLSSQVEPSPADGAIPEQLEVQAVTSPLLKEALGMDGSKRSPPRPAKALPTPPGSFEMHPLPPLAMNGTFVPETHQPSPFGASSIAFDGVKMSRQPSNRPQFSPTAAQASASDLSNKLPVSPNYNKRRSFLLSSLPSGSGYVAMDLASRSQKAPMNVSAGGTPPAKEEVLQSERRLDMDELLMGGASAIRPKKVAKESPKRAPKGDAPGSSAVSVNSVDALSGNRFGLKLGKWGVSHF